MPGRILIIELGIILLIGIVIGGIVIGVPDGSLNNGSRHEYAWTNGDWEIRYRHGAKPYYDGNACISHLKHIDGAKATWALENKKVNSDVPTPTDLFGPSAYIRDTPLCPGGGTYRIGPVWRKSSCSLADHGHSL